MAAAWQDLVRDSAAVREAAAVAVDAALLAGVLMRTGEQPHASDVSAQPGEERLPCRGSLSLPQGAASQGAAFAVPSLGCSSQPIPVMSAAPQGAARPYRFSFPRRGIDLGKLRKLPVVVLGVNAFPSLSPPI